MFLHSMMLQFCHPGLGNVWYILSAKELLMLMNIKLVHIVPMKDQIEEIEEFGIPSIILSTKGWHATKDDMPHVWHLERWNYKLAFGAAEYFIECKNSKHVVEWRFSAKQSSILKKMAPRLAFWVDRHVGAKIGIKHHGGRLQCGRCNA